MMFIFLCIPRSNFLAWCVRFVFRKEDMPSLPSWEAHGCWGYRDQRWWHCHPQLSRWLRDARRWQVTHCPLSDGRPLEWQSEV